MARITVVNDYPDFLELMTTILDEMAGHKVVGFDSSEATLEDLVDARPDLLIVDMQTAEAFLAATAGTSRDRAAATLGQVPMIVCSGNVPALREKADAFADFPHVHTLEKPFTLYGLSYLVEQALEEATHSSVA